MTEMVSPTREITFIRTIFTLPGRVYAAFSSPEGWCVWCCEQAEVEARIGGKLHIYTEGYNVDGKFTTLDQDRTIAFTWEGDNEPPTLIRVSLAGQDNRTIMIFKVIGLGSDQTWAAIVAFLERIGGHVLDNLKVVLEKKQRWNIERIEIRKITCKEK